MPDHPEIDGLTNARVPDAAALLAEALHDDPAYRFVLGDGGVRSGALEAFFRLHLSGHVPHRCTYVRPDATGRIEATVTVRPPGGVPVSGVQIARRLVPFAVRYGAGTIRRLLALKACYEAIEARGAGRRPYWHVHMMAVRPDQQGRGLGRRLLGDVLGSLDTADEPVVLTTHKEINVSFYHRLGFAVAFRATVRLAPGAPYDVWCMRRHPTTEGDSGRTGLPVGGADR